jgi:hypothetical protein
MMMMMMMMMMMSLTPLRSELTYTVKTDVFRQNCHISPSKLTSSVKTARFHRQN